MSRPPALWGDIMGSRAYRLVGRLLDRLAGPWPDEPRLHRDHTRRHRAVYGWDSGAWQYAWPPRGTRWEGY